MAGALVLPQALHAQCLTARCDATDGATDRVRWSGELQVAGVNAALGGITAGLFSKVHGGSFGHAFSRGLIGGAGVYAGKRVATARFTTAGLLGREVAAVGSSMVRNAADGRGAFDRFVLPVGLARVHLDRSGPLRARVGADLSAIVATVYAATRPELSFDAGATFSAGLPVFIAREGFQGRSWEGRHMAGVVWLRENVAEQSGGSVHSRVLAHEVIHSMQNDFAFIAWSMPAEAHLRRRMFGPASPYMDLGFQVPGLGALSLLTRYDARPWEREAHFLAGTGH